MTRLSLAAASALALAGCVVIPVATDDSRPPPPPPSRTVTPPPEPEPVIWYHGPHFIPDDEGGGWCYEEGAHTHPYFPDRPDEYVVERGYYTYDGPSIFLYVGGHPLPGGGWCFIAGPHEHDYFPPFHGGFVWHHRHGFTYEGPYRPQRPAPPAYWPRPTGWRRVPPPRQLPVVVPPPYRPPRGRPALPPPRVIPDRPDDDRGRFDDRDGDHGRRLDDDRDRRPAGHMDDRPRFDDHGRRIYRLDGDAPGATPTPNATGDDRKPDLKPGDRPAGAGTDTPVVKERRDQTPARRPGMGADHGKDAERGRTDAVRPRKADDDKDDAPRRSDRVRR